jgi:cell division protein FtsZ
VQEAVHPEANIIFGAVIDDTLGDEVRVTVIAAGFDGGEPNAKAAEARTLTALATAAGVASMSGGGELADTQALDDEDIPDGPSWTDADSQLVQAAAVDPAFDEETDDLDIPDFLK